jgi:hypothetical protein
VARLSIALVAAGIAFAAAGCGGGGDTTTAVPCDDKAFRAQDEELYVTQNAVSNALGGGGARAAILADLRSAHRVLGAYLDAHPPCDAHLGEVETTEREALDAIAEAISSLGNGDDATASLKDAMQELDGAQTRLSSAG